MTEGEYKVRYLNLVDKVRRMRGHQKQYFRYRASDDLRRAKAWEREVDKIIAEEVKTQRSNQKELF